MATVDKALAKQGITTKAVERWKEEMPCEQEMVPKDKYTMFDRKEKKYRKGIHSEFMRNLQAARTPLTRLQNYQNGRDCLRESTLQDTDWEVVGRCIIQV